MNITAASGYGDQIALTLMGKVTPKARPRNHGRQHYLPAPYRNWKDAAIQELTAQAMALPVTFPLTRAGITVTLQGNHRGDTDNLVGAVLDALVQSGILKDDRLSCIPSLHIDHCPDGEPGVVISLCPLPSTPPRMQRKRPKQRKCA